MTKCIVLGAYEEKGENPIVFTHLLNTLKAVDTSAELPSSYNHVELVSKDYASDFDLMFAYNITRNNGTLYLGRWNDGIV